MADDAVLAFPQRPQDRLRLALRGLEQALAEQGAAVAAWRGGLAELAAATGHLDGTLCAFRDELDAVDEAVRQAGEEARRLDRTADALLAAAGAAPPA